MSKKKKHKSAEENKEVVLDQPSETQEVLLPEFQISEPEQLLGIADAAARYITDYKKHWVGPLKASAKGAGIDPESLQPSNVWKQVFKTWGAVVK